MQLRLKALRDGEKKRGREGGWEGGWGKEGGMPRDGLMNVENPGDGSMNGEKSRDGLMNGARRIPKCSCPGVVNDSGNSCGA